MCSTVGSAEQRVREALEAYPSDPGELGDEALERGFAELQAISQVVEARRLRWLGEVQRRGAFRRDGYLSAPAWLEDRFGLSPGAAREDLRTAQALRAIPGIAVGLEEAAVSSSKAQVLARAWEAHPEDAEAASEGLLRAAAGTPVRELRRVVGEWCARVEADQGLQEAERAHDRRFFDLCPTPAGTVRVTGELDAEGGECVMAAVGAVVDAEARSGGGDLRTSSQRRADALVFLARSYLDSPDRPGVGGERPHLTLTVDLQVLRGLEAGGAELDRAGAVHPEAARRVACDASLRRVVLGGASEPLDVGRRTPVIPAGLRRAVVLRDRSCRFPGCGRPHPWCDAHHVRHWAAGGPTSLANLLLLCRPHHRLVHEGGFGLELVEGGPRFTRVDGSVIGEERSPP